MDHARITMELLSHGQPSNRDTIFHVEAYMHDIMAFGEAIYLHHDHAIFGCKRRVPGQG